MLRIGYNQTSMDAQEPEQLADHCHDDHTCGALHSSGQRSLHNGIDELIDVRTSCQLEQSPKHCAEHDDDKHGNQNIERVCNACRNRCRHFDLDLLNTGQPVEQIGDEDRHQHTNKQTLCTQNSAAQAAGLAGCFLNGHCDSVGHHGKILYHVLLENSRTSISNS